MSFYNTHSQPIEGQMRGRIYSDRVPTLVRAQGPDFLQDLRNIVARHDSIENRAVDVESRLRSVFGTPEPSPVLSRDQVQRFRWGGSPGTVLRLHGLVLRLDQYVRNAQGVSPVNPGWCVRGKGRHYYAMSLRRLLEIVSGAPSWRYRATPPEPEEVPLPPDPKLVEIDFCKNRFAALFDYECGTGVDDDSWMDLPLQDTYTSTIVKVSTEQRRYVAQADANETRRRMKYPPKTKASIHAEEYHHAKKGVEHEVLLKRLVKSILKPFCEEYRRDCGVDELHTTTVRSYFALERWSHEYCKYMGVDRHPGNWEPDLGILPEVG